MVRWFELFGDQYFGFWVPGVVLFAIQEIPYMVMPPGDESDHEHGGDISGAGCM